MIMARHVRNLYETSFGIIYFVTVVCFHHPPPIFQLCTSWFSLSRKVIGTKLQAKICNYIRPDAVMFDDTKRYFSFIVWLVKIFIGKWFAEVLKPTWSSLSFPLYTLTCSSLYLSLSLPTNSLLFRCTLCRRLPCVYFSSARRRRLVPFFPVKWI